MQYTNKRFELLIMQAHFSLNDEFKTTNDPNT